MEKVRILIDTDMGSDCDDAGAFAVLHNLADLGEAEIIGATHCATEISGAITVKAVNEWYKREDIPVGRYDRGAFLEGGTYARYTKPIAEKYLMTHKTPVFEAAVRVMRRALAEHTGVTLVTIGMMNNIELLLKSEPDDISPLSGTELVKKGVKNMYAMGGNFADLTQAEYNIQSAVESARYVAENFPAPIIYCGFEVGVNVITGIKLENAHKDNPVRFAYYTGLDGSSIKEKPLRYSWDPITVYCAVRQETPLYSKSRSMKICFDETGRVILEENGKDSYLIANASDEEVRSTIDEFLF